MYLPTGEWVSSQLGRVRLVSIGYEHLLAITTTGALYAWGTASSKLGLGEDVAEDQRVLSTPRHVMALAGVPVRMAVAAPEHSIVVTEAGDVYTWGENRYGQLGHGDREERCVPALVDTLAQPLAEEEKRALETIQEQEGVLARLGLGVTVIVQRARQLLAARRGGRSPVVEVAAGDYHCLAKCVDGSIFSWGSSDEGQLGHGDTRQQLVPKLIESSVLSPTSGAQ